MRQFTLIFLFFLLAGFSTGCPRKDMAPPLSVICTLDGFGGGDCARPDGSTLYLKPSEMKNFWATTQEDESKFAAWCYKVPNRVTTAALDRLRHHIVTHMEPVPDPQPQTLAEPIPDTVWAEGGNDAGG